MILKAMERILRAAAVLFFGLLIRTSPVLAEDPVSAVQRFWSDIERLERISNEESRRAEIVSLLENHFDFNGFYQRALIDHWEGWDAVQRESFDRQFRIRLSETLSRQFNRVSGQTDRKILYSKKRSGSDLLVIARTNFDGQPLQVKSHLSRDGKVWKIVDVDVDGALLSRQYRAQFNNILRRYGYAELLRRLQEPKT